MMKRLLLILFLCSVLLTGCRTPGKAGQQQYTATFLNLFDTVTTIVGRADSQEDFQTQANAIRDDLQRYHQLFDIYHSYEGMANLKTINDNAGIAPVQVDPILIQFLLDCREYYRLTDGRVNVAMGSVLQLWHEARNQGIQDPANAQLPDPEALQAAALHTNMENLQIDAGSGTVYISDSLMQLDVGAVAKGWATQRAAENAPAGMLISVGGNVCATGPKLSDGTPWVIGIQDPNQASQNIHAIYVTGGSVVTSGDYQRTYHVDGVAYHHIIDPDTRMPAQHWRSVTVVCADSGLADALSTGLFLLDHAQGLALAKACGAEVLWIAPDGTEYMTDGFRSQLRS